MAVFLLNQPTMSCGVFPGPTTITGLPHCRRAASSPATPWIILPLKPSSLRFAAFKARAAVEKGGCLGASFYDLLGISQGGSLEEIKRAYKQMARKYHPDVSPPDLAEEYTRRFIEVQEAYETLSDPCRRAMYDRDLARGLQFALTSRRRFDQDLEEKSMWKNRWRDQLESLKSRSMSNNSTANLSWAARIRKQRVAESSSTK
ncbi:DnaJ domain-containing protein [Dioscorea alata]|uniref:DnaJ domain-containing protein n=1 Tax=Dioscorea alata TaxID=55571 RepID=A0ACB7V9L8_DIOAL|nr:DnaJ domain-containing protein [Dioscorea alata]